MTAPRWTGPANAVVADAIRDGMILRGYQAECLPGLSYPGDVVVSVDGVAIAYVPRNGDVQVLMRLDEQGRPMVNGKLLARRAA